MTPYAMFRFDGEVVEMEREEFEDAVAVGKDCECGKCINCRAFAYYKEQEK
jgi:threonine dehydrogenase-like Zn-dependent dehydrogenase